MLKNFLTYQHWQKRKNWEDDEINSWTNNCMYGMVIAISISLGLSLFLNKIIYSQIKILFNKLMLSQFFYKSEIMDVS